MSDADRALVGEEARSVFGWGEGRSGELLARLGSIEYSEHEKPPVSFRARQEVFSPN